MPRPLNPGQKIKGYEILEELGSGNFAISYKARSADGQMVFLKQCKSPAIRVPWYKAYVKYQAEMKRRIEAGRVRNFCCHILDYFEADWGVRTFFQVFEFIDGGHDLERELERGRRRREDLTFAQRLILAKVLLAGIDALHEANVIHCDLKPANVQLLKDPGITAGFQLKLIDIDRSILSDQQAPWHGVDGYTGSPHYFSPEHRTGKIPLEASDVFTCGLILYELMAQGHPYLADDDDQYDEQVLGYRAKPPKLLGTMSEPASNADVEKAMYRCLDPVASNRPTAREMNLLLNGKRIAKSTVTPKRPEAPREPTTNCGPLQLCVDGKQIRLNVATRITRHLCRQFGEEAIYLDDPQCVVEPRNGHWFVIPAKATRNQTLLNGHAVVEAAALNEGDILAVGNESRRVIKLPMNVKL